ncbi:T9SS type A sorting domain-containing protein [Flammeovirga kamogawensis]|uniref:T9SS type A sorting domain-containing protein n=1 Tax=Flammeovirga kamogawensis TaxID=373891 RepID=A0ABX8GSA6_9BACT|nr:T9SS type A sorting domain-containing protein [Flammeovirga kamogawensis]MBB6463688.1 hypothetical protein [Flammeovirga kamogawensis]QWG06188.1 T9SS type A sorting domain-containing protein [Flammeovirga kamogawensis]TRX68019.1 T9SS type A sorting domain-containing protein [Flammeovirga kamogawensis]
MKRLFLIILTLSLFTPLYNYSHALNLEAEQDGIEWDGNTFSESNDFDGTFPYSVYANATGNITFSPLLDENDGSIFDLDGIRDDYIKLGYAEVENLPEGLRLEVVPISDTRLQITLVDTANYHSDNEDIYNLRLILLDDAFQNGSASDYANTSKVYSVNFRDAPPITDSDFEIISSTQFIETSADDGAVEGSLVLNLVGGDTLAGIIGQDLVETGFVKPINIPEGLTLSVIRNSLTEVSISLIGNADNHADANDISCGWIFEDSAFLNVTNSVVDFAVSEEYIEIDFSTIEVNLIEDSDFIISSRLPFIENDANDGSVGGSMVLNLTGGDKLNGAIEADLVTLGYVVPNNVPQGLTLSAIKNSDYKVTITLTGNAANHTIDDDVTFGWTFQDHAFEILNADVIDYAVYLEASSISFMTDDPPLFTDSDFVVVEQGNFKENVINNGTIVGSLELSLTGGDTLSGLVGNDLVALNHITPTNIPDGLILKALKTSSTNVIFSLSGTATDHSSQTKNFGYSFKDSAFGEIPASEINFSTISTLSVLFHDGYDPEITLTTSLAGNATSFTEREPYDGGFGNMQVHFNLVHDKFIDSVANLIEVNNLPEGLTANFTRVHNKLLTMTVSGTANAHSPSDSITTTITFLDSAFVDFTNTLVAGYTQDIQFKFQEFQGITLNNYSLSENPRNDGSIEGSVIINLLGDETFNGYNGEDFTASSKVIFSNLPEGLEGNVIRLSDTSLELSFLYSATSHKQEIDDVNDVVISIQNSAFTSAVFPTLVNQTINNFELNFVEAPITPTLTYSTKVFSEDMDNEGTIENAVVVSLYNATFSDSISTNNIDVSNLPAGFDIELSRISETQVRLSMNGSTTAHFDNDDIENLMITFNDNGLGAINDHVITTIENYTFTSKINFSEIYGMYWGDMVFNEDTSTYLGDIVTKQLVQVSNRKTFIGAIGDTLSEYINVANIPTGLSTEIVKVSDQVIELSFTGKAVENDYINTTYDGAIILKKTIFTEEDITSFENISHQGIQFNFYDTPGVNYSKDYLNESFSFDGSIADSLFLSVQGDIQFETGNTDLLSANLAQVTGVPNGLTAHIELTDSENIIVYFTGNAVNHGDNEDVTVSIQLLDQLFVDGTNEHFFNLQKDININFRDTAPYLVWDANIFTESNVDDGSLTGSKTVTLVGDTFIGTNDSPIYAYTIQNVPDGLTAIVTKVDDNNCTLTFTGNATNHNNVDDANDIIITFTDEAFVSTDVSAFLGLTNTDYPIELNFNDTPITDSDFVVVSYSQFKENSNNNGVVEGELVMDLTGGDVILGKVGVNLVDQGLVVANNVPNGLTLNVVKNSSTQVRVFFTGNASNSQSTVTFGWTFLDAAFANLPAATIDLAILPSAYQIEFNDPNQSVFDGSTWSNGQPTTRTNVVIEPNVTYNVTNDIIVNSVNLGSNSKISVKPSASITVNNDLVNNGVITIENGGFLIQTENSEYRGTGVVEYTVKGTGIETVYNYFSSPFNSHQSFGENIYSYDPTIPQTHSYTELNKGWVAHNGAMVPGQGYTATNVNLKKLSGIPNNKEVTIAVKKGAHTGFNLLGNPYISPIRIDRFIDENGAKGSNLIQSAVYFWDQNTETGSNLVSSDYATFKPGIGGVSGGSSDLPNGEIAVGQGFYVEAKSTGNVTFTNAMRSSNNQQFFRVKNATEFARMWLNVVHEDGYFNQVLVAFKEDASNEYDAQFDVKKFVGNPGFSLFTGITSTEDKFVINVLDDFDIPSKEVPVGLITAHGGIHKFSVPNWDNMEGIPMLLLDKETGIEYNLEDGEAHINLAAGQYENRFYLIFEQRSVLSLEDEIRSLKLGTSLSQIHFNTSSKIEQVEIYTLDGSHVLSLKDIVPNSSVYHSLKRGLYIISVNQNNKISNYKMALK